MSDIVAYHLGISSSYNVRLHGENENLAYLAIGYSHDPESSLQETIAGYERDFIRGIFDVCGRIEDNAVLLVFPNLALFELVKHVIPTYYSVHMVKHEAQVIVEYLDAGAVDLLGWLYYEVDHLARAANIMQEHRYMKLTRLLMGQEYKPSKRVPSIKYFKVLEDAVPPMKTHGSDSGYDLTLVAVSKVIAMPSGDGIVTLYDTGIIVEPPPGYYFDAIPRSSLFKTGHILANSVGVIDRSYRDTIKVPLMKLDPKTPDLALPFRAVQLVPRRIEHFLTEETKRILNTQRGKGGFGSTNA